MILRPLVVRRTLSIKSFQNIVQLSCQGSVWSSSKQHQHHQRALSFSTESKPHLQSLFKNPIVHQLWSARQEAKKMHKENESGTYSQEGKPPSKSRVEVEYLFSQNELLLETYRNPWGQMRFGKILEDLDALAGNIAFSHVNDPGPVIVRIVYSFGWQVKMHVRRPFQSHQFFCFLLCTRS